MTLSTDSFLASVNISKEIIEPLHTGVAIFDNNAKLVFANTTYRKMYRLGEDYWGLDCRDLFLTARQGVLEVLKTGVGNSCASVSFNGLYGVTYRWPLRYPDGKIAGCMTENISVSTHRKKIVEVRKIIDELDGQDDYSVTFQPRNSGEFAGFESIVGESQAMRSMKSKGRHFAQHGEPILILGESGTGKELVARAIHATSRRASGNFVAVNCAAIPNDLMESELYGYEAGAFTGARSSGKAGQFEMADGGTIFLDEIGEMPLPLQAKLLRVLENQEIKKLGASHTKRVDFRLISATNRNLEQMVAKGQFREDLYYRLNLFDIVVPPLRERIADIPLLAWSIISELLGPEYANSVQVSREVLALFSTHPWRGNVRELRNTLVYAVYAMKDSEKELCVRHLPARFKEASPEEFALASMPQSSGAGASRQAKLDERIRQAQRETILDALAKCDNNKSKAAKMLGIARSNIYRKISSLGIEKKIDI